MGGSGEGQGGGEGQWGGGEIAAIRENHTKYTNSLHWQNAEF
jgi:hypothetical protein